MNRTVHIKGRTLRLDVYSSRLYLRKRLHLKDGDRGYAVIRGREVTLMWNEKIHMWCTPSFMLATANPVFVGHLGMSA